MSAIDPQAFEPEDSGSEHWTITDKAKADWALRRLAKAKAAIAENQALFDQEMNRLVEWQDKADREHVHDVEYFEGQLRKWHESQIEADPEDAEAWKRDKNKTIKLPAGELSISKNPPSIEIDEDTFVPWALDNHPEWVKVERVVTRKPIKADIKKALEDGKLADPETGEKVPGVTVTANELRWKAVTE
jgi:hypothetical protein